MGLRCLLGHDFDEPGIEREREEDGNEVVTTVREVKTCDRCGETQIVSENTEVTTIQQLTEAATGDDVTSSEDAATSTADEDPVGSPDPEPSGGPTGVPADLDPDAGGAEIIDAGPDDASASPTDGVSAADDPATADERVTGDDHAPSDDPAAGDDPKPSDDPATASASDEDDAELIEAAPDARSDAGAETTDAGDESRRTDAADADDGVILRNGDVPADASDRERGAWPEVDADEGSAAEPQPWPEQRGEDEGFSAEIDENGDGSDGVELGGGLTPEVTAELDADDETEFIEAPDAAPDEDRFAADAAGESDPAETGITRGESPDLRTPADGTETEYYCPECGMTRGADGNSMRAGDICPECKRGYVDERPT